MEPQPVAHVANLPQLFMSIIDENLTEDNNDLLTLKISADAGQELLKIGLEVKFFSNISMLKKIIFFTDFHEKIESLFSNGYSCNESLQGKHGKFIFDL